MRVLSIVRVPVRLVSMLNDGRRGAKPRWNCDRTRLLRVELFGAAGKQVRSTGSGQALRIAQDDKLEKLCRRRVAPENRSGWERFFRLVVRSGGTSSSMRGRTARSIGVRQHRLRYSVGASRMEHFQFQPQKPMKREPAWIEAIPKLRGGIGLPPSRGMCLQKCSWVLLIGWDKAFL